MSPQRGKHNTATSKGKSTHTVNTTKKQKQKQQYSHPEASTSYLSFPSSSSKGGHLIQDINTHNNNSQSNSKKHNAHQHKNYNKDHDDDHKEDDDHQQDPSSSNPPPHHPPPPRKDKQQQQNKKNKKKRTYEESNSSNSNNNSNGHDAKQSIKGSSSKIANASLVRPINADGIVEIEDSDDDNNEDEEEADGDDVDHEAEADDEHDNSKHSPKKKVKKQHHTHTSDSGINDSLLSGQKPAKVKTNRLVLRLPKRTKGFGPSISAPTTSTASATTTTSRSNPLHPSTLSQSIGSSHQSSSELSDVDLPEDGQSAINVDDKLPSSLTTDLKSQNETEAQTQAQAQADRESIAAAMELAYESESSDGYSDLLDDDEDDLLEAEEAYLIADKLNRQGRHSRRGTHSPGTKRSSDGVPSDSEGHELSHNEHHFQLNSEPALFEIAQLDHGESTSDMEDDREVPVTWSGAEDDDILNDLDEFLGITKDDSAALRGLNTGTETEEVDDGQTMRFEDFLAEDDGSDSGSSDCSTEEEESSSEDDEEQSVAATGTDIAERDDDEHIETTRDLVKKGGFVFFKTAAYDDDDETESEDEHLGIEDDGGDTTDTLDDTDHIGMMRFGIEAADEDDEDAEEALANAIRDRNLIDAHNMGLSVSIDALAEQPEAVVLKTARSLGISTEMATKILTSVGMTILVNATGGSSRENQSESRQSSTGSKDQLSSAPVALAGPMSLHSSQNVPASLAPATGSRSLPNQVRKTFEPVLGDFAPTGEADLCVVVGANEGPAPSPFSARKKRTRSSLRNMHAYPSPNGRGQSVASSISTQSMASGRLAHSNSSEEPQYSFILELDDLVDSRMLPGTMSSVSEEDEDIDDGASVSTALENPASVAGVVGDVSRWNRVPIGAFRSQNPDAYASLANAVFHGARDPVAAHDLSFHSEMIAPVSGVSRGRSRRYIPVSPVLFPVGQSIKSITAVKASRKHSKDKKIKERRSGSNVKSEDGSRAGTPRSRPSSSQRSKRLGQNFLRLPQTQHSLPSDGLTHQISPLFSGVASGLSIPPLSL